MDTDGSVPPHANGAFRPLANDGLETGDSDMGALGLASRARADTSFGYARENTYELA